MTIIHQRTDFERAVVKRSEELHALLINAMRSYFRSLGNPEIAQQYSEHDADSLIEVGC
jgi:uncharacterized protein YllA (UPF0747 family)